jgi:hypothetical protein
VPSELIAVDFLRCNEGGTRHTLHFDKTDYSVVVKNRAAPPNPWRWEVYRAGRSRPIRQSLVSFGTMAAASKAGKAALKQLMGKLRAQQPRDPQGG